MCSKVPLTLISLLCFFIACNHSFLVHYVQNLQNVESDPLAEATSSIILNFTIDGGYTVDIILRTIDLLQAPGYNVILDQLLISIAGTTPYRISDVQNRRNSSRRNKCVFLVKDLGSTQLILDAITWPLFDFKGNYIIAFTKTLKRPLEVLEKIFTHFFNLYILNVVVLMKDTDLTSTVNLYTYFPFAADNCKNTAPVLYNQFSDGKFQKDLPPFPEKAGNFYQCSLRFVGFHYPPVLDLRSFQNGRLRPRGIDGNILLILAEELNFTWTVLMERAISDRGVIHENGTSSGSMKIMIEGNGNFSMAGTALTYERSLHLSFSSCYFFSLLVFALPPAKSYSSLYRIFFPFSMELWSIIGFVFSVTFVIILILRMTSRQYLKLIAGERNNSPFLHMIGIALGVTTPTMPEYNIAKTLFMFWIVSTAVLRTLYQGVLYTFLQKKEYRASPTTIEGMISSGHVPYVPTHFEFLIKPFTPKYFLTIGVDLTSYYESLHQPGFDGMVLHTDLALKYFNSVNWCKPALRALPQKLIFLPIAILYKRDSYLQVPFDAILQKLTVSGLLDCWASEILNRTEKITRYQVQEIPRINLSDLEGCIRFCSYILLFSILLFCIELVIVRVPRLKRFLDSSLRLN